MIIILCVLFLLLIAIAVFAWFWKRDKDKAEASADRAVKAAEAATAAAESSAAANRELHAIISKQQQQLASVGVEAEAVPLLPPGGSPADPGAGTATGSAAPMEGTKEWMATGDFVSNTFYEHYGTRRTIEKAGIQLSDVQERAPLPPTGIAPGSFAASARSTAGGSSGPSYVPPVPVPTPSSPSGRQPSLQIRTGPLGQPLINSSSGPLHDPSAAFQPKQ